MRAGHLNTSEEDEFLRQTKQLLDFAKKKMGMPSKLMENKSHSQEDAQTTSKPQQSADPSLVSPPPEDGKKLPPQEKHPPIEAHQRTASSEGMLLPEAVDVISEDPAHPKVVYKSVAPSSVAVEVKVSQPSAQEELTVVTSSYDLTQTGQNLFSSFASTQDHPIPVPGTDMMVSQHTCHST